MQPRNHPSRRKTATTLRLVGAQLALFRRLAGYTQRELAERLNVGEETIASIEQGRRPLKGDLAERLDLELGTRGVLAVAVEYMPEVEKYPVWAAEFIDYEREAIAHYSYENQVFPGLLQTEAYARAVFRNEIPVLSEEEIDERVAARLARQDIIRRKVPIDASFIIAENVLMQRLGGEAVRLEQLRRVRECADLPGVSVQVMPLDNETHPGLSGPCVLLETPDHLRVAYVETQCGGQLVSDQQQVSLMARKYAMLRTEALNPEDSKGLLDRLLGEQ
ncbi:transcriptional regulator [Streptomyces sp. Ru73]|uniref:helix-turn-helix domain-containing protein n=1 Tax=Streptomyces sp. Ru73 TaxID=2080748 RepID=UPI000CDD8213|nr:helix-turn-helix transcriptional regulator [Streptomyces sp. Ru73]POX37583.1 transcriptional regulator [Streptomyces sp. Ru73]